MRISDVIGTLQAIEKVYGDVEVYRFREVISRKVTEITPILMCHEGITNETFAMKCPSENGCKSQFTGVYIY